ncbi:DMT family transporter [Paracoccus sp. DMF]|uniref:DMT family transporter n=1 Tax=Paracoccus sp. DMF TaxID=400837 RepID=UPI0021E47D17|nr:DMT family transporter [Paracoccus sp. DMF]MCV2445841.1 DMT family transporter [Paracoccus sp. DMF]
MPTTTESRPLLAAAWMMGAVAAFTLMAVAGRMVQGELDTFEILAWRSLIGMAIIAAVLSLRGDWGAVNLRRPGLHLARNVTHFVAQNLWFHALFTIPLAQVFALEFTAPLWVLILAPFLLGERLTRARALSAGLGFLGILVIVQPGAAGISAGALVGVGAAALAAVGFGLTYVCTKMLTGVAGASCILWWMSLSQALMGLACAGIDGGIALPSAAAAPWVLVLGLTGLGAHFCITRALGLAPATLVMPFDFLRLPVIAVVGLLLYAEPVGLAVVLGSTLILAGNYLNIRAAGRPAAEAPA